MCGGELESVGELVRLSLGDGTENAAHAVVIATGARYRRLPLPTWEAFEGAGIFFAATEIEAQICRGEPSAVVGGANSAGQAALFLEASMLQEQRFAGRSWMSPSTSATP